MRLSLFAKTLLLLLLNLAVVGAVLAGFFAIQTQQSPRARFWNLGNAHFETVARIIAEDLRFTTPEERETILKKYSETYKVDFYLYADSGERLAGSLSPLPETVLSKVTEPYRLNGPREGPEEERLRVPFDTNRPEPERPRQGPPENADGPPERGRPGPPPDGRNGPPDRPRQGPPREEEHFRHGGPFPHNPFPPPVRQVVFQMSSSNPSLYWVGIRIPLVESERRRPIRSTLLAASDSITGNGLFFNPWPWVGLVVTVFGLSVVIWFPFVRSLSREIGRLTKATEQIADEKFDVRVNEKRSDELGRLGKAVNHLAERLSNFVTGQKRFLGDVSHELNTPLARMQYALSILEEQVEEPLRPYIGDVQEDVRAMSQLVDELLGYTRAGLQPVAPDLKPVEVAPVIQRAVEREAGEVEITTDIENGLTVKAVEDLLARAVGNVVRNAVRYAGTAGPIHITAKHRQRSAVIRVEDRGPGVPEDQLGKIFDPFYRVASDRARSSGGVGLGLAIVKSSVAACGGTVSAHANTPNGLIVEMTIPLVE
jgi:two-component system sensor histidine kinase CpxA